MAVSINTTFHFNSGAIPFSSLRQVFKETDTGAVKASQLIRDTSIYNENPVVPDADENSNIVTTQSGWKTSQFRGSCKEYEAVQSGTDDANDTAGYGFRLGRAAHGSGGIPWGGNMTKNIKKNIYVTGEVGCNNPDPNTAALGFSPDYDSPNVYVEVSGTVRGCGGEGGAVGGGSGNPGGPGARFITNRPLKVAVVGSGFIRGGGGGGEGGSDGTAGTAGSDGTDGSAASCRKVDNNTGRNCCSPCGGCPSGYRREYCHNRQGRCGWCGQYRDWECRRVQNESRDPGTKGFKGNAGTKGTGGTGGRGRGWTNYGPGSSLDGGVGNPGNPGSPGNPGNTWQRCRANWSTENRGSDGNPGNPGNAGNPGTSGGTGGRWGESGGNTTGPGSAGAGGRGIAGSGYTVVEGGGNIIGGY